MEGARCFEAKKAINHELEAHGYGGGQKEDEEDDGGVGVCYGGVNQKERRRVWNC